VAQGAEVRAGGLAEGTVFAPTVLTGVAPGMRIASEEAFGPVLAIAGYDALPDAIAAANATAYGLQAGIFTRDVASAFLAAQTLDFGGVTVNEAPSFRLDHTPYGGVKDSGNAKEGPARTVEAMTNERLVVLDIVSRP
jgi:acyl-CoA reductase-like NAD-dependent aldehyde dehydrogenase